MLSLLAGHDSSKASVQVFIDNYALRIIKSLPIMLCKVPGAPLTLEF
jgi:hypothetical protein